MNSRFKIFTGLILKISRCISKIKNLEMFGLKLKGKQVLCLFNLFNTGGASVTSLAKMCDEDKGALSRTIGELQKDGLVYIEESTQKKYRNPVKLTEQGTNVAKVVVEKIERIVGLCGKDIEDNERDNLYDTLEKISNNLAQICKLYGGKNGQNIGG